MPPDHHAVHDVLADKELAVPGEGLRRPGSRGCEEPSSAHFPHLLELLRLLALS